MGQCSERLLDLKGAYREYCKAISIDPTREAYHVSLAALLVSQKAFGSADTVLSAAITRFPHSVTIIVMRGLVELETGNPENARKDYQSAMEVERDSPLTCELLGRIEMVEGNYSAAIQAFKRAAAFAPLDPQPDFYEGLAYTRVENGTDKAIECFSRSLQLNPELPEPIFLAWLPLF